MDMDARIAALEDSRLTPEEKLAKLTELTPAQKFAQLTPREQQEGKIMTWLLAIILFAGVYFWVKNKDTVPTLEQEQISDCRSRVRMTLKDPTSMTAEVANGGVRKTVGNKDVVFVPYRASNSFGGMVAYTTICTFTTETRTMVGFSNKAGWN